VFKFKEVIALLAMTAMLSVIVVQHRMYSSLENKLLNLNELFCESDIQCENMDYSGKWEGK
jgi:hypothetical protein